MPDGPPSSSVYDNPSSSSVYDQPTSRPSATWPQDAPDPYHPRAPRGATDPRQVQAGGAPSRPRPRQAPGEDYQRHQPYGGQAPGAGVRRPPSADDPRMRQQQRAAQPPGYPPTQRQYPPRPAPRDPFDRERPRERERERPGGGGGRGGGGMALPFGLGSLFGVAGLALFVLSLTSLPWARASGVSMSLPDIREAFATIGDLPSDADPATTTTLTVPSTLPEGIPSPGDVQDAVEDEVRDAATDAANAAVDSAKGTYLELYSKTIWLFAAIAIGLAVLFATILAPTSFALKLILGFQRMGSAVTVLVGLLHGAALWVVFSGSPAPTPALGAYASVAGLLFVLVGCILGPRKA